MPLALGAIALGAVLTMVGEETGRRRLVYVCKPLTTLLILLVAAVPAAADPRYRALVVIGLACSLVGDVFLMLPRDRFLAGLASFLAAHAAYAVAFAAPLAGRSGVVLACLGAFGVLMLVVLWPGLAPRLRGPVAGYVAAIVTMAWLAGNRWLVLGTAAAGSAAAGAALFLASDALLALDRFRGRFRLARTAVLSTYYAGQTLIALSVR